MRRMNYLITTRTGATIGLTSRRQPGRIRRFLRHRVACAGCRGRRHRSAFPGFHR